jgi:predicted ATPase
MLKKIRIQNFKCLQDTKDIEIRPLTFLVGPNSSGKSSVFQAILALKQTVESGDQRSPLILQDYIDLGSYKDVFFNHDTNKDIKIDFEDINPLKWSVTFSVQENERTPGKIFVKSLELSGRKSGSKSIFGGLKIVKEQKGEDYKIECGDKENVSDSPLNSNKFYIISTKQPILLPKIEIASTVYRFLPIRIETEKLFDYIYHVGPLRHEPERVYSASGAYPPSVGKNGQWTIHIRPYNEKIRDILKYWLEKFNISVDFTLEELKKGSKRYEIVLKDYFTKTEVNLADVGFSTSQILPIIVQGFISPKHATLLLEQPEIHLHPKAQCVMGDLLVDIIKTKKRLIIETHSDLLIDRVCKHILLKDENKITPDDIIIYYFEPTKVSTKIRPITVNENAQYENFPEDFFKERFEEALSRAALMT